MTATITATKEQLQSIGIEYEITGAMCDVLPANWTDRNRRIDMYTVYNDELVRVQKSIPTEWLKFEE